MIGERALPVALWAALLLAGAACVPASADIPEQAPAAPQASAVPPAPAPPLSPPPPPAAPEPALPASFTYAGELTQGGWIRGQVPAGTLSARLDGQQLAFDAQGNFFAAFDRDAGPTAQLVATLAGGGTHSEQLTITARNWRIEHVNAAFRPSGSSEAFLQRRRPELERIAAARARDTGAQGWRERFVRPASGRYSGFFGSQRVYRGQPGSYHSGLDIAGGAGGQVIAPASGTVVLATDEPFTLEGYLLIIDHGAGLNSAFLHLSRIDVREGQEVRQGEPIGLIGSSGRTSGPHLHWGLKWHGTRLDPLLFLDSTP